MSDQALVCTRMADTMQLLVAANELKDMFRLLVHVLREQNKEIAESGGLKSKNT